MTERLHSHFTFLHWRRKWQPTPVFLPGESQRWRSLVGCHLWGRTESDTTEAPQQQQQHVKSLQSCPTLLQSHGLHPARLHCPWDSPGNILKWVAMPSSRGFPDPGIEPASPASPVLQEDSLLLSHWGSPILPIGLWLFITIVASIPITSKNDAIVVQSLSHV